MYIKYAYTNITSYCTCCSAAKRHIDIIGFCCISCYIIACANIAVCNVNGNLRNLVTSFIFKAAITGINRRSNFCFTNTCGCKSTSCSCNKLIRILSVNTVSIIYFFFSIFVCNFLPNSCNCNISTCGCCTCGNVSRKLINVTYFFCS